MAKENPMNYNRRRFLAGSAAALAGTFIPESLPARHQHNSPEVNMHLPSLKGRKILYVYGGWKGHEPYESVGLFKPWLDEQGAKVKVFDTLDPYTDPVLMKETDLVIQVVTMSEISKEQEKGLLDAVREGCGFAGWHGGTCDSFRQNTNYQFMTGGQWVAHPGGIIDYSVRIKDRTDPVTRGLNDFSMHSEQYYMHVDPNVNVLATTRFNADHAPWIDGCIIPVVWKKTYGRGRIFYSSLGHVAADFDVPEASEIVKRGMLWACESRHHPAEPWVSPVYE